jgi:RNA recognition motif-containing protein
MASDEEAAAAITALNGRDFGGRALTVSEARERPARGGPGADRGGRPPRRGGF